ncbi:MAG: hypothetical protein PVG30_09405 [Gammaproteobacteria bacterium]
MPAAIPTHGLNLLSGSSLYVLAGIPFSICIDWFLPILAREKPPVQKNNIVC